MTSQEIKKIRNALGLTQVAFAKKIGVSFATVNRWENGHKAPSSLALKVLQKMARQAERAKS